jgi:hypothetical protein
MPELRGAISRLLTNVALMSVASTDSIWMRFGIRVDA